MGAMPLPAVPAPAVPVPAVRFRSRHDIPRTACGLPTSRREPPTENVDVLEAD